MVQNGYHHEIEINHDHDLDQGHVLDHPIITNILPTPLIAKAVVVAVTAAIEEK